MLNGIISKPSPVPFFFPSSFLPSLDIVGGYLSRPAQKDGWMGEMSQGTMQSSWYHTID